MKKLLQVGSFVFFVGVVPLCAMDSAFVESIAIDAEIDSLRKELRDLAEFADDLFGNESLTHAKKLKTAKDVVRVKIIKALTRPMASGLGDGVSAVLEAVQAAPPLGKSVLDCLPSYAQRIRALLTPKRVAVHVDEKFSVRDGVGGSNTAVVASSFLLDRRRDEHRSVSPTALQELESFAHLSIEPCFGEGAIARDFGTLLSRLAGYELVARVEDQVQDAITELSGHMDAGTCTRSVIVTVAERLLGAFGRDSVRSRSLAGAAVVDREELVDFSGIFRRLEVILETFYARPEIPVSAVQPLVVVVRELLRVLPQGHGEVESRWPAVRAALTGIVELDLGRRSATEMLNIVEIRVVTEAIKALRDASTLLDVHLAVPMVPLVHMDAPVRNHHDRGTGCCQIGCGGLMVVVVLVGVLAYALEQVLVISGQ